MHLAALSKLSASLHERSRQIGVLAHCLHASSLSATFSVTLDWDWSLVSASVWRHCFCWRRGPFLDSLVSWKFPSSGDSKGNGRFSDLDCAVLGDGFEHLLVGSSCVRRLPRKRNPISFVPVACGSFLHKWGLGCLGEYPPLQWHQEVSFCVACLDLDKMHTKTRARTTEGRNKRTT